MTDVKTLYPDRYYASYDKTAQQPTRVTGWYDTWVMSNLTKVPAASDMIPVSSENWANETSFRLPLGKGVLDGVIVDYTPPATTDLKTEATSALAGARSYVLNAYTVKNITTPDAWVTYLNALEAIENGTDTTSTELPQAPAE